MCIAKKTTDRSQKFWQKESIVVDFEPDRQCSSEVERTSCLTESLPAHERGQVGELRA